ncbi:MAG: hypothetical protein WDN00_12560 [Limisphaerales bacterium]
MIHNFLPRCFIAAALLCVSAGSVLAGKSPVDYANPLVGTASLDDPKLLGNAPPPGEEAYSGFTYPGPALTASRHHSRADQQGFDRGGGQSWHYFSYVHSRRTMLGFSSPMPSLTIMPVIGNWNVPPDRSYASPYDKQTEKASPGYYSVSFPDSGIKTELAATERVGYYRFTFPQTERGTVLINLGAGDNSIEIVGRPNCSRTWRARWTLHCGRILQAVQGVRNVPPKSAASRRRTRQAR